MFDITTALMVSCGAYLVAAALAAAARRLWFTAQPS